MGKPTQLHQGSLNGLRRQTNECLDNAYNKGYQVGYDFAVANAQETKEELGEAEYKRGLEDSRQILLRLLAIPSGEYVEMFNNENCYYVQAILSRYSISEIEDRVKAYEEKKKADEIKVGDEVDVNGDLAIVTRINPNDYDVFYYDGMTGEPSKQNCEKTGRHFDEIEQIFDKLGGKND